MYKKWYKPFLGNFFPNIHRRTAPSLAREIHSHRSKVEGGQSPEKSLIPKAAGGSATHTRQPLIFPNTQKKAACPFCLKMI
jgi:hypothetical protein